MFSKYVLFSYYTDSKDFIAARWCTINEIDVFLQKVIHSIVSVADPYWYAKSISFRF